MALVIRRFLLHFENQFYPVSFGSTALFLFTWLMMGISLGLTTLMGPIRWLTDFVRDTSFLVEFEDLFVRVIIALFVVVTFYISLLLVRRFYKTKYALMRVGIVLFTLLSGGSASWILVHPSEFDVVLSEQEFYNPQFSFGPYPSRERMVELKKEGFTGIITLVSDKELFFEQIKLKEERANAQSVGLPLVELPMLPWIGGEKNQKSINLIKEFARKNEGRYYVHCYLGKDRVRFVQMALSREFGHPLQTPYRAERNLKLMRQLERGPIIHLPGKLFLSRQLNTDEMMGFILNTKVKQIYSFLSPELINQSSIELGEGRLVEERENLIAQDLVPTEVVPLYPPCYSPGKFIPVSRELKLVDAPKFGIIDRVDDAVVNGLVNAYMYGIPSLNRHHFLDEKWKGRVALTTPNIAVGTRPNIEELNALKQAGIQEIISVGHNDPTMEKWATSLDLKYQTKKWSSRKVYRKWMLGGPYYFYGDDLNPPEILLENYNDQYFLQQLGGRKYIFPMQDERILSSFKGSEYFKTVYLISSQLKPDYFQRVEMRKLRNLGIRVHFVPIRKSPFEGSKMRRFASHIAKQKGPIAIIYDSNEPYLYEGFIQAFFAGVTPIPPSLVDSSQGITQVGPDVLAGPKQSYEGMRFLKDVYGIRKVGFVGKPSHADVKKLKREMRHLGLSLQVQEHDSRYPSIGYLHGGPWYLMGPELKKSMYKFERYLGPILPSAKLHYAESLYFKIGELFPTKGDIKLFVMLGPLFALFTLMVVHFVGNLHHERALPVGYTRKTFHFFIFTTAGLIKLFAPLALLNLFALIVVIFVVTAICLEEKSSLFNALARPSDWPHPGKFILIPLMITALGGVTSFLLFGDFVAIGIFVCGCGDAVGEIVGTYFRNKPGHTIHAYKTPSIFGVPSERSLEGSTAVFIVSFIAALFALPFLGLSIIASLIIAFATAVVAAVVEGISNHGLDNFTVQVAASGTAFFLSHYF